MVLDLIDKLKPVSSQHTEEYFPGQHPALGRPNAGLERGGAYHANSHATQLTHATILIFKGLHQVRVSLFVLFLLFTKKLSGWLIGGFMYNLTYHISNIRYSYTFINLSSNKLMADAARRCLVRY